MKNSTRILATMLVAASFGTAHAQDTFNFVGTNCDSIDLFGDASNQILAGPVVASTYQITGTVRIQSLTLTSIVSGTWRNEWRVGIRNSSAPTVQGRFQATTTTGTYTTLNFANVDVALTNGMAGITIPAGSTWAVEFAESVEDGADTAESRGTNLVFSTNAAAPVQQSWTLSGETKGVVGDPGNTVVNLGTYSGSAYRVGSDLRVTGGTATLLNTSSTLDDAIVVLRNSAVPLERIAFVPTATATIGAATLNINTISPILTSASYGRNLYGALITPGSTWTAELAEGVDLPGSETQFTGLSFGITAGSYVAATGTAPAAFTDLGAINISTAPVSAPVSVLVPAIPANTVRWYKFTVPAFNQGGKFLDIFGEPLSGATTTSDTFFTLYDASGKIIAGDDDSAQGVLSDVTIGDSVNVRPGGPAIGAITAGFAHDGFNGDGLLGGTYFLAISHWSAAYSDGFLAVPTTSTTATPFNLKLQTNVSVPIFTIAGTLNLLDTIGNSGTESIGWTLDNGSSSYTGTVSVSDVGSSAYSFNIPAAAPNGNYTLKFKGGTFLSKTLNVTLTGASLTGQNASLKNGDIDQDGEVGPSDFDTVVAQFGGAGDADVDNDGEVGPSDFDTVVANFGIGDE